MIRKRTDYPIEWFVHRSRSSSHLSPLQLFREIALVLAVFFPCPSIYPKKSFHSARSSGI